MDSNAWDKMLEEAKEHPAYWEIEVHGLFVEVIGMWVIVIDVRA